MTFEQFQASRTWCDDLSTVIPDARWENEQTPAKGYVYLGNLYIEMVQSHWPQAARDAGQWLLLLERDDWVTDDREGLELRLYDWAVSAGYADSPTDGDGDRFAALIDEYQDWMKAHGLQLGSADEHHFDENLTIDQRAWLKEFSERWEHVAQTKENP